MRFAPKDRVAFSAAAGKRRDRHAMSNVNSLQGGRGEVMIGSAGVVQEAEGLLDRSATLNRCAEMVDCVGIGGLEEAELVGGVMVSCPYPLAQELLRHCAAAGQFSESSAWSKGAAASAVPVTRKLRREVEEVFMLEA